MGLTVCISNVRDVNITGVSFVNNNNDNDESTLMVQSASVFNMTRTIFEGNRGPQVNFELIHSSKRFTFTDYHTGYTCCQY